MLEAQLKQKINSLWDKFWSGGIANPLTAIEQMSYLIFMKRLEDQDNALAKRAAGKKEQFESVFEGTFKANQNMTFEKEQCRWSHFKHLPADEMLVHVRDIVFPFIKQLDDSEGSFFAQHMKDAVFLIPKASLLQEAVGIIDELNIAAKNIDTQGDIYEYLLSELQSSGKNGQFRTPRHIIRMMVKLANPDINDTICDPACGTAGFLINAYEHIVRRYTSDEFVKEEAHGEYHGLVGDKITDKRHWQKLWSETFYGYDFDTTMVRIGLMNMILHGIKQPHVSYMDTLSKQYDIKSRYSVILANPPFTGSIDGSNINDKLLTKTTKTELLFLEAMYQMLTVGGRCAVVVPNGVLFGSSNAHKSIRKMLLEKCQLEAVISLPSGVFKPYSGVATSILYFVKGGKTDKVWFYDMKSDGYSLDDKRDDLGNEGDIPDIISQFSSKGESSQSMCVSFADIKENDYILSYSRYHEAEHVEISYDDPKVLIDRVLDAEDSIKKELEELKRMVK